MRRACGFWALRRTVTALTVAGGSVSWRMCPTASSPGPVGKTRVVGPCARPRVKAVMGMAIGAASSHHETNKRAKCPPFRRTVCARGPAADGLGLCSFAGAPFGRVGVGAACCWWRMCAGTICSWRTRGPWPRVLVPMWERATACRASGGRRPRIGASGCWRRSSTRCLVADARGSRRAGGVSKWVPGAARWRFGSPSGWARAVGWSLLAVDMVASTACRMSWVAASGCDTNEG